jgi:hypothetical protein
MNYTEIQNFEWGPLPPLSYTWVRPWLLGAVKTLVFLLFLPEQEDDAVPRDSALPLQLLPPCGPPRRDSDAAARRWSSGRRARARPSPSHPSASIGRRRPLRPVTHAVRIKGRRGPCASRQTASQGLWLKGRRTPTFAHAPLHFLAFSAPTFFFGELLKLLEQC